MTLLCGRVSADGFVEQDGGRIERDGGVGGGCVGATAGRAFAARVFDGVDGTQEESLAFVLDPRRLVHVDEAACDGDEAASEKALVELPVVTVEGQGTVAANAATDTDGEGVAELSLVEAIDGTRGGVIHAGRRATEQRGVRGLVVVLVEEGPQTDIDVVERGRLTKEVEAALAQGAPEALHLAARGGVERRACISEMPMRAHAVDRCSPRYVAPLSRYKASGGP